MGKYDDITPERLRSDLVGFARFVIRLDQEDRILTSAAHLQKILGELRQKLFAYEIRSSHLTLEAGSGSAAQTDASQAAEETDPVVKNSLRVVREALRRTEEMLQEWDGNEPDDDRDEDE